MAEQYKLIHPVKYYRDYLNHKIRPDGREFIEFRKLNINIGQITTADGSAVVKIGQTNVICGIRAELAKPKASEPNKGYIVPHIEISSVASLKCRIGTSKEDAEIYTYNLNEIIQNSGCVELEELCIAKDKLVWCLYCDIICLGFDGCVLDASLIAIICALKNLKLPEVEYNAEIDAISVNNNVKSKIKVKSMPVSASFMIFDDNTLIVDPTSEEENLSSTIVTLAVNNSEVCFMFKPGGTPFSDEDMDVCKDQAISREKYVLQMINEALQNTDT